MDRRRMMVWSLVALLAVGMWSGVGSASPVPGGSGDLGCDFPLTVTDATGADVRIDAPPERIVALTPSDAQTLWEFEARDRIVGMPVSQYTSYLDGHDRAADITVDDGVTIDLEQVVGREPDLVLAGNVTPDDDVEALRRANQTVYHFRTATTIDDVMDHVRIVGRLVDECDRADATVERMRSDLETVETAVMDVDRPLVYYAMGDGWTAGAGTFQHEIITTAGGENLGARAGIEGWNRLSDEVIVEEDPEWIVYGHTFEEPPISAAGRSTTAWERSQVVEVNAHYLDQPGPRVVAAIVEITEALHPDEYEAAVADSSDRSGSAVDDESGSESNQDEDPATPSVDPQSGFGVVIGIVAGSLAVWAIAGRERDP